MNFVKEYIIGQRKSFAKVWGKWSLIYLSLLPIYTCTDVGIGRTYVYVFHRVLTRVSILFIFKHDFRWRIDFRPNRPWKGFAWAPIFMCQDAICLFCPPQSEREGKNPKNVVHFARSLLKLSSLTFRIRTHAARLWKKNLFVFPHSRKLIALRFAYKGQ